ncbi:MAG: phage tail sheath family protein, partial [Solirubrobacterales bacterium]|nr:phage tail sheath family protein [Solirubrobacterales bacterium]
MPVSLTYPGVYVQELPNPVRPIVGVPTSIAAFVGTAPRGQVDDPIEVDSWLDYERTFGSLNPQVATLDPAVPLSYAVYLFFLNGGARALVVR